MRVCDIKGCGEPAKEVCVDVNVAIPHDDDFGSASIDSLRYRMDLCEGHLGALYKAIAAFEVEEKADA